MSKKKTVKKTEASPQLVDGIDARVLINVYSPGHEPQEFRVTVPNITGAVNLLHRSPESVKDAIVDGLRKKFGERVK